MAIRPKVGEDISYTAADTGTGRIGKTYDYLAAADPISYFYNKLKNTSGTSKYLNDNMWQEAVNRGEAEIYTSLLSGRAGLDKKYTESVMSGKGDSAYQKDIDKLRQLESYEDKLDYDTYMLALSLPMLDDTKKEKKVDEETGYEYGEFTQKEWVHQILDSAIAKYDAYIIEENKANMNFFELAWNNIKAGLGELTLGTFSFLNDIYNIGEGLINIFANQGDDTDIGKRFMWAFTNDEFEDDFAEALYDVERRYTHMVNAVDAYYTGDGGYTTWGKIWKGLNSSIGYMLPSMILSAVTGGTTTPLFYTGMFGGNIKDTISQAENNGLTYKDLNAGEVVSNAAIKAGAQWAVEWALGKIIGYSAQDKAMGLGKEAGAKELGNIAKEGAFGSFLLRTAKESAKEGLEEVLQDMSDGIVDFFYGSAGTNLSETYLQNSNQMLNISNLFDSFYMGALTNIVVGSVQNLTFLPKSQRAVGVDADGKTYSLGFFQTLNFNEALKTLNEWNDTLHKPSAKVEERQNAALKMTASMSVLGEVLRSMGQERAIIANNILLEYAKSNAKHEELNKLSDADYATNLFNIFSDKYSAAKKEFKNILKNDKRNLITKIKDAFTNNAKDLKTKNVSEIKSVTTSDNSTMPDSNVTSQVKTLTNELGVQAIVGVDGAIVRRSGDIMIVPNKSLETGNLADIVRQDAFNRVQETVKSALTPAQRKMLVSEYSKVVPGKTSLNEAITALLFDKSFYTKMLLLTEEKKFKTNENRQQALQILATIGSIAKRKVIEETVKGRLSQDAFNKLMEKVLDTMQTGLLTYATNYVNIDLDKISNDIITPELREKIKNHPNVIFTNTVNEGIKNAKAKQPVSNKAIDRYNFEIEKYQSVLGKYNIDINTLKQDVAGNDYNKQLQAWTILAVLAKNNQLVDKEYSANKVLYLVDENSQEGLIENEYVQDMEKVLGISFKELMNGEFETFQLNKDAQTLLNNYGGNTDTGRLALARDTLFELSNGTLTVSNGFRITEVLRKEDILKDKYANTETGNKQLKADLRAGELFTVKDIVKDSKIIPDFLADIRLQYDPDFADSGEYSDGNDYILIGNTGNTNTIMHELTHVCQSAIGAKVGEDYVTGGSELLFKGMKFEEAERLNKYLAENFPIIYDLLSKINADYTFANITYYMLEGELEANSTVNTIMPTMGFRYSNDKLNLVSPDGTTTFSLKDARIGKTTKIPGIIKKTELKVYNPNNFNDILEFGQLNEKLARQMPKANQAEAISKQYKVDADLARDFIKDKLNVETNDYEALNKALLLSNLNKDMFEGEDRTLFEAGKAYINDMSIYNKELAKWMDKVKAEITKTNKQQITSKEIAQTNTYTLPDNIKQALENKYSDYSIENVNIEKIINDNKLLDDKSILSRRAEIWGTKFEDYKLDKNKYDTNINDPILLTIDENGKTKIDDGMHRLIALYNAGYTNAQLLVRDIRTLISRDTEIKETKDDELKLTRKGKSGRIYVNNKDAKTSNLKYWVHKGKPILIDKAVARFVRGTTKNFDRLPTILKNKITSGKLTKFDVLDYTATARNMDEFTFKALAKLFFKNDELANITVADMKKLQNNIVSLAVAGKFTDKQFSLMSPDEMLDTKAEVEKSIEDDSKLSDKYVKEIKYATKVKGQDAIADPEQLNILFFEYYNGTLYSLRSINNLAKFANYNQQALLMSNTEIDTAIAKSQDEAGLDKTWNWLEHKKLANIDYDYTDDKEMTNTLDSIEKVDKINAIEPFIRALYEKKLASMSREDKSKYYEMGYTDAEIIESKVDSTLDSLYKLSDSELNKKYLIAMANRTGTVIKEEIGKAVDVEKRYAEETATTKNRKDQTRNLLKTIVRKIAGQKTIYNALQSTKAINQIGTNIQQYLLYDEKTKVYSINPDSYRNMTDNELDNLIATLKTANEWLKNYKTRTQIKKAREALTEQAIEKAFQKYMKQKAVKPEAQKTTRQKVQYEYITKIKETRFEFVTPVDSNDLVKHILDTTWSKTRKSEVQAISENTEQNVASANDFYTQNGEAIMNASLADVENAIAWFLDTRFSSNMSQEEIRKFMSLKTYFLGFVNERTKSGEMFDTLNNNLKQRIQTALEADVGLGATLMSIYNNVRHKLNPLEAMASADVEIDGVVLDNETKKELFDSISSNDMDRINAIENKIIQIVKEQRLSKNSILKNINTIRSMSMLSSPLTWLRNTVSNVVLKRLNKVSSLIGNRIFTKVSGKEQLKLDEKLSVKFDKSGKVIFKGEINKTIQDYIIKNFIDNKMFDTLIGNLSKYNPSDIKEKFKDKAGNVSKEVIMTQMVMKSLYGKYYNETIFTSKKNTKTAAIMNRTYQLLMKVMSDDSYVREAAIRYFGKILAERNYDLSKNEITDNVMRDFSSSVGLALADYMHSDNFFNSIERAVKDKTGEAGWFIYKQVLPFAAASWNWFKAAYTVSPIGLVHSIYRITHLEQQITKAEMQWAEGKTEIAPYLTEYKIRRDLGSGIIGTIAFGLGLILASLGYIRLDDEDYGTPKLVLFGGKLSVDVSSIFGTSSILAGAALVDGFKDGNLLTGLNQLTDVALENLPLMQLIEMDMYSAGGFSMISDYMQNMALSYIPNGIGWLANLTYRGTLKKDNFFQKAIAKIPFLNLAAVSAGWMQTKVDPYTGKTGSYLENFNRFVPYFSLKLASQNELKTRALGLNKTMLRGKYTVNNKSFTVSGTTLTNINKAYGEWNSKDLENFYNNKTTVRVKVDNKYKELKYNQMTDAQRKNAIQTIMSNNAEFAKIMAWTSKGNKYYASQEVYTILKKRGITTNVYRGTKGYVEK